MTAAEPFGDRIAKLRAQRGLTQQVLADRVAVSRVALSHIEAGLSWPNERTVLLLAGEFAIEPPELVEGTSYPPAKSERLPATAKRYTEIDLQLLLFAQDCSWLEAIPSGDRAAVIAVLMDRWDHKLRDLAAPGVGALQTDAIWNAHRLLLDLRTAESDPTR